MYLPFINGADEGNFSIGVLFTITGVMGQEFWTKKYFGMEMPLNLVCFYFLVSVAAINVFFKLRELVVKFLVFIILGSIGLEIYGK